MPPPPPLDDFPDTAESSKLLEGQHVAEYKKQCQIAETAWNAKDWDVVIKAYTEEINYRVHARELRIKHNVKVDSGHDLRIQNILRLIGIAAINSVQAGKELAEAQRAAAMAKKFPAGSFASRLSASSIAASSGNAELKK